MILSYVLYIQVYTGSVCPSAVPSVGPSPVPIEPSGSKIVVVVIVVLKFTVRIFPFCFT